MKPTILLRKILFFVCIFLSGTSFLLAQQVGINTASPADGAILDISSSNKGLLTPRVNLTSSTDVTTITPSAPVGLLVYNMITSGSLPFQVTPGFYYWNGIQWLRFYNRGYGIIFKQGSETIADGSSSVYKQITDLDSGFINVPYSGTYHIKVETAYACGESSGGNSEGVGQASISLNTTTGVSGTPVRVKEKYVTSTSKRVGNTTINSIPQKTTIIYIVDLNVLETYRFNVTGREWSRDRVSIGTFGKDTSGYTGSTGSNDAQRGSVSITLIRQQ